MILTRKRLLVDIFLTRRLSRSLAVCESASVNFEPCKPSIAQRNIDKLYRNQSYTSKLLLRLIHRGFLVIFL